MLESIWKPHLDYLKGLKGPSMPSGFGCYVGYMKIDNSYLLFIIACLPDELEFCMRQLWQRGIFVSHSHRSLAGSYRAVPGAD